MKLEELKVYENDFFNFRKEINYIGKMLNNYIKSIGKYQTKDTNQVNEDDIFPDS